MYDLSSQDPFLNPIFSFLPGTSAVSAKNNDSVSEIIPNRVCGMEWASHSYTLAVGTNEQAVYVFSIDLALFTKSAVYKSLSWEKKREMAPKIVEAFSMLSFSYSQDALSPKKMQIYDALNHEQQVTLDKLINTKSPDVVCSIMASICEQVGITSIAPKSVYDHYSSAIKAIAWNPAYPSLLATGGGRLDRQIRLIDTRNGTTVGQLDTKHQITGLNWSAKGDELLVSYGYYSFQMELYKLTFSPLWKNHKSSLKSSCMSTSNLISKLHPANFDLLRTYSGHTDRILCTAVNPTQSRGKFLN